ncbi:MAG: SGNH/GDSL hydrolase family protein [Bacteroidia bacterium]|nr:SGNH/GDSL hydrolase family protein [Bacteroidia bacterium]MCZ2276827.1 SGNH/GDSL hydrolase family protein [Bacteroidia bacterium]
MKLKQIFSKGNLLYALFIFIFLIVCLEIFGRIYLTQILHKSTKPKFRFSYTRIFEHIPGFKEGDGKRDWIVINNQGFRRATDIPVQKPANTIRIFFMGGSAAHGISSAAPYPIRHIYMDETVDAWLEKYLKPKYPEYKIEVINAAVTGYQVFQHTSYILSELLDYHPDIIIFFDGANDHYFSSTIFNYYLDNRYQFWKARLQHPSCSGMTDYFMHWLSNFSGFARGYMAWKLNYDARKMDNLNPVNMQYASAAEMIRQHRESAPRQYLRAIETNLSILENNQIKPLICLQPMLVLRDSLLYSKDEKDFYRANANVSTLYPVVLEELKALTSQHHAPFVDINLKFNDPAFSHQQLFIDYCHLSPFGGDVAARSILPVLDSLIQQITVR